LKPLLGPASLILLDGSAHRERRKLLMPAFHGERMRKYGTAMRELTDKSIDAWPLGTPFAIHGRMQGITLDVILRAVFGVEDPRALAPLRAALLRLIGHTANPAMILMVSRTGEVWAAELQRRLGRFTPWGRFMRLRAEVDLLLAAEFARRRAEGSAGRHDVLSMLLEARDEEGLGLSDDELRDEMITMLMAGHETTATALAWAFFRILSDDSVLDRLREELRTVTRGQVEPEHVSELVYLDAVIKETARLHPVLPFVVRELQVPMEIGGMDLPRGVIVAPNIVLAHRRADIWPHPERFDPSRFLGGPIRGDRFFPFGGGVRTCLGMAFATYEMKMVLARVLERTVLRLAPGYRPRLVRRGIVLAPSKGVPVVLEEGRP